MRSNANKNDHAIFQLKFFRQLPVYIVTNLRVMLESVFLVMLLLNDASAQKTVEGFIGGSALLPCHAERTTITVITAHWRYDDNKNVYDILNGQGKTKEQAPEYRDRTETFPAEYSKGNFTLKLRSLQKSDEGSYCCFVIEFGLNECVNLQVKEKPRGIQTSPDSNGGGESTAGWIVSLLILLFSVTLQL
ncbi:CD276 antigen homolog [Puntigrus tetrazona]|uniref:CD276 antigen homolog n=1 Tax=Puntigrus tetrazona TaxID=1606681 RepID=UPI001C8A684F|nr:CD276 antigen homolog [Puntigrus tetrazona]